MINIIENTYVQVLIIIIFVCIIIYLLCTDNFIDNFNIPPHIQDLKMSQKTLYEDVNNNPPNYDSDDNDDNNNEDNKQIGNILRINTGRDAYQQEQFVSIYDSNFGGLLGTTLGTKM